jgi:membrane protease YdiL (CAAX protease family)
MTGDPLASQRATSITARTTVLLLALSCAAALRWMLSRTSGPQSMFAGLVFAACLAALATAAGIPAPRRPMISIIGGTLGAAVLTGPALVRADVTSFGQRSIAGFLPWMAVTATVAITEEAFLRGALFDLVEQLRGETAAAITSAVVFAGLHVPLYGWHIFPLDLAVGMLLATLRVLVGNWSAPALAHVLADATGWWLR